MTFPFIMLDVFPLKTKLIDAATSVSVALTCVSDYTTLKELKLSDIFITRRGREILVYRETP